MIKKKKIIIDVCGVPGVGKSTIVSKIISLNKNILYHQNLPFFDVYSIKEFRGNYFQALTNCMKATIMSFFYSKKISGFFISLLLERKINIVECITQIQFNSRMMKTLSDAKLILSPVIVIRDGGIGNIIAEAAMYDFKKSKDLVKKFIETKEMPDVIIFLSADYKTLLKRFNSRSGKNREKKIYNIKTNSYFTRFETHNFAKYYLKELSEGENFNIYDVDASKDLSNTLREVIYILDNLEN